MIDVAGAQIEAFGFAQAHDLGVEFGGVAREVLHVERAFEHEHPAARRAVVVNRTHGKRRPIHGDDLVLGSDCEPRAAVRTWDERQP